MKVMQGRSGGGLRVLGVMTGTSCDGLDLACLEFKDGKVKPLFEKSLAYREDLRQRVLDLQKPGVSISLAALLELNRDLGLWYASELRKALQRARVTVDVISLHGQTVAHFPRLAEGGVTLQLGDASRVAVATGATVVSQLREGDMAAGGQGAPLVPRFHQLLAAAVFRKPEAIAIHNIGGVSNLTYFGPKGKILAFDTGPGNMWIDAAVHKISKGKESFDFNGRRSAVGTIDEMAVQRILRHPFFTQPLPKSTGRDDFPSELLFKATAARGDSLVATAAEITIVSIAQAYEKYILSAGLPLKNVVVCGGGARNRTVLKGLSGRLPSIGVISIDELGWDSQFVEAHAFAYFGYLTLVGQPLGGDWTGSKQYGPPGHIIPGRNWLELVRKIAGERGTRVGSALLKDRSHGKVSSSRYSTSSLRFRTSEMSHLPWS